MYLNPDECIVYKCENCPTRWFHVPGSHFRVFATCDKDASKGPVQLPRCEEVSREEARVLAVLES